VVAREHPCLDVRVTKESIDRTLRIFDALLKGWRARAWPAETMIDQPLLTRVTVLDERFCVRLDERSAQSGFPDHLSNREAGWLRGSRTPMNQPDNSPSGSVMARRTVETCEPGAMESAGDSKAA